MINTSINNIIVYAPKNREELIDFAFEQKKILVAVNAEKILHAGTALRSIINTNIGYPDGIGAVWALQKKKNIATVKIPGCELWLDIIERYHTEKSFYLVGGTPKVISETVQLLKKTFPAINICNYSDGYITSIEQRSNLIADIALLKPDVVFVAMGSPKQELLMQEMQSKHSAVYQGLGGSFDVYTGNVLRAPKWWVNNNLEWAYRLYKQPTRITRQLPLIKFFFLLKMGRL